MPGPKVLARLRRCIQGPEGPCSLRCKNLLPRGKNLRFVATNSLDQGPEGPLIPIVKASRVRTAMSLMRTGRPDSALTLDRQQTLGYGGNDLLVERVNAQIALN